MFFLNRGGAEARHVAEIRWKVSHFSPAAGGVGEIGMNLYLYGYGRGGARDWLIVDMGVTFGSEAEPGIDIILPDISFIEEERHNIAGLLLTHAHEDHFGAVIDLWPLLANVPVYATPFTAEMLKSKLAETGMANGFPLHVMPLGGRRTIGPFDVELINMSHSIPEPSAVVIRTPLGTALHTGDWKLDETPLTSAPTDAARLKALGEDGISALICDSTNAVREGISASEADVAVTLARLIRDAPQLVAVTTFASNVARIGSVAKSARARAARGGGRRACSAYRGGASHRYLDPDLPSIDTALPNCRAQCGAVTAASELAPPGAHRPSDIQCERRRGTGIFSSAPPRRRKAVARVQNGLADWGSKSSPTRCAVHVSAIPRGDLGSFMVGEARDRHPDARRGPASGGPCQARGKARREPGRARPERDHGAADARAGQDHRRGAGWTAVPRRRHPHSGRCRAGARPPQAELCRIGRGAWCCRTRGDAGRARNALTGLPATDNAARLRRDRPRRRDRHHRQPTKPKRKDQALVSEAVRAAVRAAVIRHGARSRCARCWLRCCSAQAARSARTKETDH